MSSNLQSSDTTEDSISDFTYGIIFSVGVFFLILLITFACTRVNCTYNRPSQPVPNTSMPITQQNSVTIIEQGLDEATLSSYPKLMYSEIKKGGSTTSCCSICLLDYKESDMLRLLPHCSHLFHLNCIDPWIKLHPTCPVCRDTPNTTTLIAGVDPLESTSRQDN